MSVVYATVPLAVHTFSVKGELQGVKWSWAIRDEAGLPIDESPAIYKSEAAAMNAGRAAAYRYAQRACEEAAGWK